MASSLYRLLNPKSSYERILMAPPCRLIVGEYVYDPGMRGHGRCMGGRRGRKETVDWSTGSGGGECVHTVPPPPLLPPSLSIPLPSSYHRLIFPFPFVHHQPHEWKEEQLLTVETRTPLSITARITKLVGGEILSEL